MKKISVSGSILYAFINGIVSSSGSVSYPEGSWVAIELCSRTYFDRESTLL